MELLNSGVDSMYWTARGAVAETMAAIAEYQAAARAEHHAIPWRVLDGFSLSVEPGRGHGYRALVTCAEFAIYLGEQTTRPTFMVQLRAPFIQTVGIREAIEASRRVVGQLAAGELQDVGVSRVDPFADIGGWSLTSAEAEGVVTHVPEITSHFVPRSGLLHSVLIGKKPLALRIYDKRRELERKGGAADVFWGDYVGPVTRIEFEFWTERLKDFAVRSFDDALASIGDLWRHGTSRFVQLRVPGVGPVESWPLSPAWEFVQRVGEWKFAASGVVPSRLIKGERLTLLRNIYGYASSFAALEGLSTEREVLRRLAECFPEVARGRLFDVESRGSSLGCRRPTGSGRPSNAGVYPTSSTCADARTGAAALCGGARTLRWHQSA
jgi:hypothetical protein